MSSRSDLDSASKASEPQGSGLGGLCRVQGPEACTIAPILYLQRTTISGRLTFLRRSPVAAHHSLDQDSTSQRVFVTFRAGGGGGCDSLSLAQSGSSIDSSVFRFLDVGAPDLQRRSGST